MGDNQQQQMNIEEKRSVGETLLLVGGVVVIGLLGTLAARWVVPEVFPGDAFLRPPG